MLRSEKSCHPTVLMVPSGLTVNDPLPPESLDPPWPWSDVLTTYPFPTAARCIGSMLPVPPMLVGSAWNPPAQPPLPYERMIPFQFVGVGSQTSIPMPGDVDGAVGSPGLPGPTSSFTRHTSAGAAAGAGSAGVLASAMGDPAVKACTSSTVVCGSGWKRCLMPSSQLAAARSGGTVLELGGGVAGVDAEAQPGTDRHATAIAAAVTVRRRGALCSAGR